MTHIHTVGIMATVFENRVILRILFGWISPILVILCGSLASDVYCPPDWMLWGKSCYIKLPTTLNWTEASEACDRLGSSLAVPDSMEENDFIFWSVTGGVDGVWIGCTEMG